MPKKLIKKYKECCEIFNIMPVVILIWRITQDCSIDFVSDNIEKFLGYTAEDFISGKIVWLEIVHPEDMEKFENGHFLHKKQPFQGFVQQYRLKSKSGEYRWFEDHTSSLADKHEKFVHYQTVIMDITEQKLMEERLKDGEEKFRTLFDLADDAIFLLDGIRVVDCNKKALELFGFSSDQIIREIIFDFSSSEQVDARYSKERFLEKIKTVLYDEPQIFEWKCLRCDDTFFDAEVSISQFRFRNNIFTQVLIRDVTYRKRMEEELVKSKNLESIGTLAGGIAHDFNNLLMVIMGNISLAKLHLASDNKALERLSDAENASIAAKDLTKKLITFSRGGEPWKKNLSIAPVIKNAARFVLSGSSIKCKYIISDNLHMIYADEAQIHQVIQSIINNAKESMITGGTITIRAGNIVITQKDKIPLPHGDYIKISIEDKGAGIKDELLNKVFDPYFTTKNMSIQKGMGLGLSVSYSIIKKHDGYILLESAIGVGTTVHIYLPAFKKETKVFYQGKIPQARGRILVMDDVEEVRLVTSNMLIKLGYEAVCADDGSEAIKLYKQAREIGYPFDAVILDLTVKGGMGGKEAIVELISFDPYVKALIASGYTDDPIMDNFREYGFKGAVNKPYKMEELGEALHGLISRI